MYSLWQEGILMPLYQPLEFRGKHLEFLHDTTPEIELSGALSSGKTVVALWKELEMLRKYAGIWILISRWTESQVDTLLRPQFEQLARIHNTTLDWNAKENYYETLNGSRCFAFGLKTQSSKAEDRYGRIRGLPVSRIYVDQAEQLPGDLALELRARLRPDIEARVRGKMFPRQLTFSPNPTNFDHWLAKQFPANNSIKNRKYYALSLYDNAHNLPADMIDSMLQTYPIEHPKHTTMILGQRGMNVIGDPVYENLFDRARHVRSITPSPDQVLLEAFRIGRHNPVWLVAQRTYGGAVTLLGGVLGQHAPLEDFLPVVALKRRAWFPPETFRFKTCTSPMAGRSTVRQTRYTLLNKLQAAGYEPEWRPNGNAPDVQLAMIEEISSALRRTMPTGEPAVSISQDASRWLLATPDGTLKELQFAAFAFEGGYIWSDHTVSVAHEDVRQPHEDDLYATAMHAIENIWLNFFVETPSDAEREVTRNRIAKQQRQTRGAPVKQLHWMAI